MIESPQLCEPERKPHTIGVLASPVAAKMDDRGNDLLARQRAVEELADCPRTPLP